MPPDVGHGRQGVESWIAERRRFERRLSAQYAVSRVLAEASTLMEAAPRLIQAICESVDWQVGSVWTVDHQAGVLRCLDTWHRADVEPTAFLKVTREITFKPGIGLPGRVWSSGAPAWIPDVTVDPNFPRAPFAASAGLHGAFGFPLTRAGDFLGVMEFFSPEIREPDEDLLMTMATIGNQIGEFVERIRAQEATRESEARKTGILEAALDSIVTMDHLGRIIEFNPAAEQMFGYRGEEVIGQEMAALIIPPALREAHRLGLAKYLATGHGPVVGNRVEMTALRADGTEFPVELGITRISLDGPPMFTGYVRDITERKRWEETQRFLADASAILGSSLHYETTLQNIARLCVPRLADWCAVDMVGDGSLPRRLAVEHADPAKIELARAYRERYPPDPDAPHGVPNVLRTGNSELYPEITEALFRETIHDEEQLHILREPKLRSAMIVPLRARDHPIGAITFVSAESGRRFTADDLALAEELARRAALAAENARLYQEASDAVRIRDEFLAAVSHDLRSPLATIKGHSQLLARRLTREGEPEPDQLLKGLGSIEAAADQMSAMIGELLDLARLQVGQPLDLDLARVNLVSLIETLVDEQRSTARQQITVDSPLAELVGRWDPVRLQRVFANLVSNAAKYGPPGSEIVVQIDRDDSASPPQAVVAVHDYGVGIPSGELLRVFEPFYRASNAPPRSSGTGMGLASVRHIVEQHRGTVLVESEEGVGTTFTVRLPLLPS